MEKIFWKDIPNYEGLYQINIYGDVKSMTRRIRVLKENKIVFESLVLSTRVNKDGYVGITLFKNNKPHITTVHKLLAITFLNHEPNGMKFVVDHINFNKCDNRLENLRVVTYRQNVGHRKNKSKASSRYLGVYWNKKRNKWTPLLYHNKKLNNLGAFDNEYDAHLAYQDALLKANYKPL